MLYIIQGKVAALKSKLGICYASSFLLLFWIFNAVTT